MKKLYILPVIATYTVGGEEHHLSRHNFRQGESVQVLSENLSIVNIPFIAYLNKDNNAKCPNRLSPINYGDTVSSS